MHSPRRASNCFADIMITDIPVQSQAAPRAIYRQHSTGSTLVTEVIRLALIALIFFL